MNTPPSPKEDLKKFQDDAYVVFTEAQRKHDCPGYDCSTCFNTFEHLMANLPTHPGGLERLDEDEVEKIIEKTKWTIGAKAMSGEQHLQTSKIIAKVICERFGTPSLETLISMLPGEKDDSDHTPCGYIASECKGCKAEGYNACLAEVKKRIGELFK